MSNPVMWRPLAADILSSSLYGFAKKVGQNPEDYNALHLWSIANKGEFWSALWDYTNIIGDKGDTYLIENPNASMTQAKFFPNGKINLAENFLRQTGGGVAIIATDESGNRAQYSHDQLRAEVARVAQGLREAGIGPGDRVATVLTNDIECLVIVLATTAIGAVWTSCSPDFGAKAILDRLGAVEPKCLFVRSHYRYGGKTHNISEKINEIVAGMKSLTTLVVNDDGQLDVALEAQAFKNFGAEAPLEFTRVGFNDPVYILYTSGTTGAPKAIVHRVGGVVLQLAKEHKLHGDVRSGDCLLWYTNTAWMMYHWIIGGLVCDAKIVLYDGAPILKQADGELDCTPLWRVVESEKVTHFGVSPKYLATLAQSHFHPMEHYSLDSLRWLMSAGAPVAPQQYDWVYQHIKQEMGFASISGGTEVMGCFLTGSPMHPVIKGQLTVKALGMAVNVLDQRGAPVVGRPGDLVCTEPFPSMPLTFWGEGGQEKYLTTYFSEREEIWTHGDLAALWPDGSAVIYGRTDNTLNPGGVRIGTADIYNVCERFDDVEDCIVFGRPTDDDEEIVLCLKLKKADVAKTLATALRKAIREETSPRHVPSCIYCVPDIPYTVNGKRVEVAARSAATGQTVRNKASLANPDSLTFFEHLNKESPL